MQKMMQTLHLQLRFDPSFIEEAVFLTVKGKDQSDHLVETFHRDRERTYRTQFSLEERNQQFQSFYENYFHKLGLRQMFEQMILEFPLVCQPTVLIFFKRVWSKKEEEVELYVQEKLKTVYIGLQVIRILDWKFLKKFLAHELMRISDMLDPHFQYSPFLDLGGKNEIEDNLIRERFRILWDFYIGTRLIKKGYSREVLEEEQIKILGKSFPYWDERRCRQVLSKMQGCENLMQIDLLSWANNARTNKNFNEDLYFSNEKTKTWEEYDENYT